MFIFSEYEKNMYKDHCFRCFKIIKPNDEIQEITIKNHQFKHLECKACNIANKILEFCQICDDNHNEF